MEASSHGTTRQVRRRDFLAYGAGLALLPCPSWAVRPEGSDLAISFNGEAADTDARSSGLVSADRLSIGEPGLARSGVRVTIDGLVGDLERLPALGVRSAELRVGFPVEGVEPPVEFRAWSYQLLPIEQVACSNSFVVPIETGLALALEVETFGWQRFVTVLSTGHGRGCPKLRTGRYLISPDGLAPTGSQPLISLSVEASA